MLFDKIIYINLDRRPDRNSNVIEQLKKVGLENISERFSAIDGKKLDLDKIDQTIITPDGIEYAKESKIIYTHLTQGAIGCAMSHRAIYQKIIDENINRCLILEDDITFDDNFINKIKLLEKEIRYDFDLFFFGYHPGSSVDSINFYTPLTCKFNSVYGLFGYIVTKKGAKKLLDLFPITYQIDTEISRNTDKIDIYGVNPNNKIILSDQSQYSYKFGTDIQNRKISVDNINDKKINDKKINDNMNKNKYNCEILILLIFILLCAIIVFLYNAKT